MEGEDAEDTAPEGDPIGDRLRVVVLSGPDQVLRYVLRFNFYLDVGTPFTTRRHTEDAPKNFHGLRYVQVSFSTIAIRVIT